MTALPNSILNFPEIRVVEASAGSGKTFALARRYVQLLLSSTAGNPIALQHILAITFTNKAAYEMKSRILLFLKKIALQKFTVREEEEILAPLGLKPEAASRRAFAIMDELIRHYNFFQVQTIDSFMNALLVGCAFKLKLSASFRIRHNADEYLSFALDELIESAGRDKKVAKLFTDFLEQYLFLENKTSWFPKKDILGLLGALHHQQNFYGLEFFSYPLEQDLFTQKRKILELMRKLQKEMPEGTHKTFRDRLAGFLERYTEAFDFDQVSAYFARDEFPATKGAKVSARVTQLWEDIHERLKILSEAEACSLFNPYIEVFNQVRELYEGFSRRDDVLFLEELNRKAQRLFADGEITVDELYYRLATRLRHYLLDEFQDTSRLQWQNLSPMVDEAVASGGTLFYVGDKKQAIYSFRGGDPGLFDALKERFGQFPVHVERLERNFRSSRAIVEFNNKIFSMENLRRFIAAKAEQEAGKKKEEVVAFSGEDFRSVENVFGSSHQAVRPDKPDGYVKIHFVDAASQEERDGVVKEQVLALVARLKERFAYHDIAILTRDNNDVENLTAWLMEAGIAVESERTLDITKNVLIREILSFLRFLESPIDNRSFTDFITGEIFSRAVGKPAQAMHDFVFSLRPRVAQEKDLYVYKEFRDTFPQIWERFIDEFFRNVGLYPLYELVVSIFEKLGVFVHFPDEQGFFMRFLELIKEQEEDTSDITTFLEKFETLREEELFVQSSNTEAVRIMTVHKAKGLEFPVVIVPFLTMEPRVAEGGRLGQQSYTIHFEDNHQELLRIKQKYLPYSKRLTAIYHRNYVRSFLSELNNIYVALTRPAEELYIFIPKKNGNSFNLANLLIPPGVNEAGAVCARELISKREGVPLRLAVGAKQDWIKFLADEFGESDRVFDRLAARRGEVMHFLLSQIKNLEGQDQDAVVQQAFERGQNEFLDEKDWPGYEKVLSRILGQQALQPFFVVPDGEIQTEVEVVDQAGRLRRIDRMVVTPKEILVLDYKISREHRDKDRIQVREYLKIMSGIYPGRAGKGYVFYTEEMSLEEI